MYCTALSCCGEICNLKLATTEVSGKKKMQVPVVFDKCKHGMFHVDIISSDVPYL